MSNHKKLKQIKSKTSDREIEKFWKDVNKMDIKALAKNIKKHHKDLAKEFETKPVGKEIW